MSCGAARQRRIRQLRLQRQSHRSTYPADDVGDQLSGEQRSAARDHPRPEPKLATARLLLLLLRVLLRVLLLVVAILLRRRT